MKIIEINMFGHTIYSHDGKTYRYYDTDEIYFNEHYKDLICPKCGEKPTEDSHDPCIQNLPGIEYACCGHGIEEGYVKFKNGKVMYGNFDHMKRKKK